MCKKHSMQDIIDRSKKKEIRVVPRPPGANPPRLHYPYKGSEYSVSTLADLAGITAHTMRSRIERGWPVEKCVETPLQRRKPQEPLDI